MTRDQAIDLLQVMLLDESDPPKLRPESFVGRLRPALLEPKASAALRAAREPKGSGVDARIPVQRVGGKMERERS